MTRCVITYIFCFWISAIARGQNLIRDGGFEEIECPDNPINSISDEDPWYAIGADAYWLQVNCPFDPVASQEVVALRDIVPNGGLAFISLEAILFINGFLLTEGMGIELITPLEQGRFYYFDMSYMNYESVLSRDYISGTCSAAPARSMNVMFSDERISISTESRQIVDGFLITDIVTNGRITLTDDSPQAAGFRENQWIDFWDCFEAVGDERHIAVAGQSGRISPDNSCYEADTPGFLYSSGHAIDDLRLFEIPTMIDTAITICTTADITVDLVAIANVPYADNAVFTWREGSSTSSRLLSEAGTYLGDMILPCVTVPITVTIQEVNCKATIYVANVFSPNGDNINDFLVPSIVSELAVTGLKFCVYNRWGERVYRTSDLNAGWDGDVGSLSSSQGVYTWVLAYTLENNDVVMYESGDVLLIQ